MTAIIICPDGFDIKLCGVRFTALAAAKAREEGIVSVSFAHDSADEIRSEFEKAKDFPVVLFPVNVLTDESFSVFEAAEESIVSLSGGILSASLLPEKFDRFCDIVPRARAEGISVREVIASGYFLNVNTREDYLKAQSDILSENFVPSAGAASCGARYGAFSDRKIYFGKNTVISENVSISDGCTIGDNVYIGSDCRIVSSAVMDNAFISSGVTLINSIVHENASVGCGRTVSGKVVRSHMEKSSDTLARKIFGTDGRLSGGSVTEMYAMGKAVVGKTVCAAYSEMSEDKFRAFRDGIEASGGRVISLGAVSENVFRLFLKREAADFGIYFAENHIRPWGADALPSDERLRRTLENGINGAEEDHFDSGDGKTEEADRYVRSEYLDRLDSVFSYNGEGRFFADISCPEPFLSEVCSEFAAKHRLLDRGKKRIAFHISADGARLSAYTDETGYVFHEKLVMLCMADSGRKVSLPSDFPAAAEKIVPSERFDIAPDYDKMTEEEIKRDKKARAGADLRLYDAPLLMAEVLGILCRRNISLAKAVRDLPVYSFSGRMIPLRTDPADIFKRLGLSEKGGRLYSERGRAYARPMRTGGIILSAEAAKLEISAEICSFYEEKFKSMDE